MIVERPFTDEDIFPPIEAIEGWAEAEAFARCCENFWARMVEMYGPNPALSGDRAGHAQEPLRCDRHDFWFARLEVAHGREVPRRQEGSGAAEGIEGMAQVRPGSCRRAGRSRAQCGAGPKAAVLVTRGSTFRIVEKGGSGGTAKSYSTRVRVIEQLSDGMALCNVRGALRILKTEDLLPDDQREIGRRSS